MQTREYFWTLLLASFTAHGALAIDGEFRIGAQASRTSWHMGVEFNGDIAPAWGWNQPDTDVSAGIVSQYVVRFDVGDLRGFAGIEVSTGFDTDVTVQGPSPDDIAFAQVLPHPGRHWDGSFLPYRMSATRLADAVCVVGVDFGKVAVFGSVGASRAKAQAEYARWDYVDHGHFDELNDVDYHADGSHWGLRNDVGVEVGIVGSLILQIRATRTDFGKRTYGSATHSPIASLELTEYVATLLYPL